MILIILSLLCCCAIVATPCIFRLDFRRFIPFLRRTKSLALQPPCTSLQVLRQFAIRLKQMTTLKMQFPKLLQLSVPSASIFKYVVEMPSERHPTGYVLHLYRRRASTHADSDPDFFSDVSRFG